MKKLSIQKASIFISCSILAAPTLQAQEKTNVLFIITDDLNCYLGSYGHPVVKTPNIDRLAEKGLLFQNAYCNYPVSGPSRASMMTGLYANQTNILANAIYLRDKMPDVTTLPQVFKEYGYTATRIGKLYHYNNPGDIGTPGHDDPLSWTHTINPIGRDKAEEDKIFSLRPGHFGATLSWLAADGDDEEQTDGIVATEAVNQLKKYSETGEPFFLGVGFYKPHTPFVAPKRYFDMYPREQIQVPRVPEGYFETIPQPARDIIAMRKEQLNLHDTLAVAAIQAYFATISFMDAQVGRILDALEQFGLEENTVVIFTSDHGYHMGEHGHYQKRTLFELSTRVPLIISYPGQKTRGVVTGSIVEMIDFYPTICELAGLPYPDFVSGKSFVPVLENPKKKIRSDALTHTVFRGYSLISSKYRYNRWGDGGPGMIELYDKKNDPLEMNNLAGTQKYSGTIRRLDRKIQKRIERSEIRPEELTILD